MSRVSNRSALQADLFSFPDLSSAQDPGSVEPLLEQAGFPELIGIDEAGRGPLAGPVIAAAVRLPETHTLSGLNDSKKLSEAQRERLFHEIKDQAVSFGIAAATVAEIDTLNILQATFVAMKRALRIAEASCESTGQPHALLLIDGPHKIPLTRSQLALVRGDGRSASIAAASILAKVTRDRWMQRATRHFPNYGFERHKGYGTQAHLEALNLHGPCPIHRQSFRGVKPSR